MKIAIEALGIHDYGGGRTATLNLLHNLMLIDHENDYLVILSKPEPSLKASGDNFRQLIAPIHNRFMARIWAQFFLPLLLWQYDIVHFTKNLGLFAMRPAVIITIYDLTTLQYPKLLPKIDVWYWRNIQKLTLQRAQQIIAISQDTKKDIQKYYQIPEQKIKVIYPTIAPHFRPALPEEIQRIQQRYQISNNYILYVGRIDAKNNPSGLIEAYVQLRQKVSYSIQLVITGGVYDKAPEPGLETMIEELEVKNDIILTGRIPDKDLPALYSGARAVALLSHHEGFGLVAVEALACGTALLAHRTGALPEIVGEAASWVDNLNVENIAAKLEQIFSNNELRQQNIQLGLQQAQHYQNRSDAQHTLALYNHLR